MKLFTYIIISLIPTIGCSIKCENQEVECIELCCKEMQYYEDVSGKCKALPESARIWWESELRANDTMSEYVEFDGCEAVYYLFALNPHCVSPYYNMELKKFGAKYLFDVSCDRLREIPIAKIVAALKVGTIYICIPIMVVYTCIKAWKEKFIFKLYFSYLVFMAVYLMLDYLPWHFPKDITSVLLRLADFFLFSSWLWLDVIGFQMWSGYKEANAQDNSRNNQRRFICYSIFVCGISAIPLGIIYYGRGRWWTTGILINQAIMYFNVVTFLVLSVNICITRCKVVNLTTETWFKLRLTSLILRLGLMMGFPRILFTLFYSAGYFAEVAWFIFFTLEPFVLFIVLLWKPNNCFTCNLICSSCRKSEEIPNATEIVEIHIN